VRITEDAFAEKPAIEWLQAAGWTLRRGVELIPWPSGERKILGDVVLQQTFRPAVATLNPQLPAEAVVAAVDRAMTGSSPIRVLDHQEFHETLLAGVQVSWLDGAEGSSPRGRSSSTGRSRRTTSSRFVDQRTIVEGRQNRRPDLLLYVNGLPLGQLELDLDDWELLLALHHHGRSWDGLITTDSSMLRHGPELAALIQTPTDLDRRNEAGHNPVKASGLLFFVAAFSRRRLYPNPRAVQGLLLPLTTRVRRADVRPKPA